MAQTSDAFLAKARESLAGASSEIESGRYNNAVNRAYYACFQAAIAALDLAGVRPSGGKQAWGHDFVQAQFSGLLVNRRKVYPTTLRGTLNDLMDLRHEADYRPGNITETQAARAVVRARAFVDAVLVEAQGGSFR